MNNTTTLRVLLVACVAAAAAADVQAQVSQARPAKASSAQMKAEAEVQRAKAQKLASLRSQLNDRLNDAESARFKGEFLSLDADDRQITSACGEVNAKNAYGGYVGFGGFISTSSGLVMFQKTEPDAFNAYWTVWCTRPF